MKTAEFNYDLPPELIAQHPSPHRDEARMLVMHRTDGRLEHRRFSDFPEYLRAGDVVVVNNTRVIAARLFGRKERSAGRVELLLLEEVEPRRWDVLLRARRRPKPGEKMIFAEGQAVATLITDGELGRARVEIDSARPFQELVEEFGEPPLPPYIRRTEDGGRKTAPGPEDRARYQTIYAREPGAVAAPTAGLHFTPEIFQRLEKAGVSRAEITLHVGLGTFRPVTAENAEDHKMEPERFSISENAAQEIRDAKRVVAVGSTTVRTLEYVAATHGRVEAAAGRADIYIRPPYEFRVVNALLTNFHLPKSTLLMMICALAGKDLVMRAYEEAVRQRYRFYSYGDCMLIL